MNLSREILDRRLIEGAGERLALLVPGRDGAQATAMTFRDVAVSANRAAFVLRGRGVACGDRILCRGEVDALYLFQVLGVARLGAVAVVPCRGEDEDAEAEEGSVAPALVLEGDPQARGAGGGARETLDRRAFERLMAGARENIKATDCAPGQVAVQLGWRIPSAEIPHDPSRLARADSIGRVAGGRRDVGIVVDPRGSAAVTLCAALLTWWRGGCVALAEGPDAPAAGTGVLRVGAPSADPAAGVPCPGDSRVIDERQLLRQLGP